MYLSMPPTTMQLQPRTSSRPPSLSQPCLVREHDNGLNRGHSLTSQTRCPRLRGIYASQERHARQYQGPSRSPGYKGTRRLMDGQKVRDRQLAAPAQSESLQSLVVNEMKTKKHTAAEGLLWLVRSVQGSFSFRSPLIFLPVDWTSQLRPFDITYPMRLTSYQAHSEPLTQTHSSHIIRSSSNQFSAPPCLRRHIRKTSMRSSRKTL